MDQLLEAQEARRAAEWARISAMIAHNKAEGEKNSRFKIGQRVRVCQSPGLSLVGGIHPLPHDCSNPAQHWNSRIVGWDCFGRTDIATQYGDNPHCCEWPYGEECLTLLTEGEDWLEKSQFKIGMQVFYDYELSGFSGNTIGRETEARLKAAHIEEGDWIVEYPREDSGDWIVRVLNEKQMRLKKLTI